MGWEVGMFVKYVGHCVTSCEGFVLLKSRPVPSDLIGYMPALLRLLLSLLKKDKISHRELCKNSGVLHETVLRLKEFFMSLFWICPHFFFFFVPVCDLLVGLRG